MKDRLVVSVSPHIKGKESIFSIMLDVIIALFPALIVSIYLFGWYALMLVLISVVFCVGTEFFSQKLFKKEITINDLSAVVTGILLAFVLPPNAPLWMIAIGAVVSILLGKQVFGGLGHNLFNPALVGRAVLLVSWPIQMTTWVTPFDGVTSASPLNIIKMGLNEPLPSYLNLFLGNRVGCLGETSVLALLIGAGYLLYKKHIKLYTPLSFIGTVAVLSAVLGGNVLFNIMSGGIILGAFFMATDMVTSPLTKKGKVVFGLGCGLLTVLIRFKGGTPEGVCYAILIMNMFVPLIDRYTKPKKFGLISVKER
ncbi:RnfABCDGE type electron transport complex subunit D [bacterium]|nr:RnfABCDGE type electron transport complex subunit D [bacterium]